MNPLFQVTHSFALGSQTAPASYNFGAVFANPKVRATLSALLCIPTSIQVFMQGSVDHEGSISARFNHGWSASNVFKAQAQVRPCFTLPLLH